MRILGLFDIDHQIKVSNIKEVTSQAIYQSAQKNFHPNGLFSEEIFGQTEEEQKYRCGYIKLPIHVFNPEVMKTIIMRSGGIIKKLAYGEVRCDLENGVLINKPDGKYCGIKDLYEIWDQIDVKKTLNTKSDINITILTKSPRNQIFTDKVLVLPTSLRPIGMRNGRQTKSELNTLYMRLIGLKSVSAHTTATTYQIYNKFQDTCLDIYIYLNKYMGGKTGFLQRNLMAKNTLWTARNVISAPRYNRDKSPIDLFHTGYPLSSITSMFNPFIKFHLKQLLSFSNIQNMHPNPSEVKSSDIENIYDDKMINDLVKIFLENPGSRFKILYLDPENTKPIIFNAFDNDKKEKISRPLTLTDVIYMAAYIGVEKGEKLVYTVRYPIGDLKGSMYSFAHVLSTNDTHSVTFMNQTFEYYPVINLEYTHAQVSTAFADTVTILNSRLVALGADYDGDTIKSTGIWSDEANENAKQLMYKKIYNISPEGTTIFPIGGDCISGLYGLTKKTF